MRVDYLLLAAFRCRHASKGLCDKSHFAHIILRISASGLCEGEYSLCLQMFMQYRYIYSAVCFIDYPYDVALCIFSIIIGDIVARFHHLRKILPFFFNFENGTLPCSVISIYFIKVGHFPFNLSESYMGLQNQMPLYICRLEI